MSGHGSTASPLVWVISECYPHPTARHRCAFVHRQMVGLTRAGWSVRCLIPNGWYPPLAWRLAPAWRMARARAIGPNWTLDDISIEDLPYQNRVPSRLSRPLEIRGRIRDALSRRLSAGGRVPDVLLCQFALPYGPAVREAAITMRLPYVVHLRGDDVWVWPHQSPSETQAFSRVVRDAALVLGVSRSIIDEAARVAAAPVSGAVVPNGIDLIRFRPPVDGERARLRAGLDIGSTDRVVLCVAPQLVAKGWEELLDALGGIPMRSGPVVLVCAVSTLRDELDVRAEAARRAPNVRIILFRDVIPERLAELYRAADFFVLASRSEGMSNAMLEAMASGLSVVTTRVGGHSEVVRDGINGLLAEPRDVGSIRHALLTVIESPETQRRMGAAARRTAEHIGGSDETGARLAVLLDRVSKRAPMDETLTQSPYAIADVRVPLPAGRVG